MGHQTGALPERTKYKKGTWPERAKYEKGAWPERAKYKNGFAKITFCCCLVPPRLPPRLSWGAAGWAAGPMGP